MPNPILTLLIVLCALLHIRAEYFGPRIQVYIFKPLATALLILLAITIRGEQPTVYRALLLAGLTFSLGGDILLMLPSDRFMPGLLSFLIAQLLYLGAFTIGRPFFASPLYLIPFAAFGALAYWFLAPGLDGMRIPVAGYIVVILAMASAAYGRYASLGSLSGWLAFLGAALFVISDAILAVNRFRFKFTSARALNLLTYFAAQYLIASSIGY
jgi:uncharacterized membrane protein YhhN